MVERTVTCRECDRIVPDSMDLCLTCIDSFIAELLTVPGIVVDMTVTSARLDRMSDGRAGGKSAEVPLPIRISGKVRENPDRDTYKEPWPHSASDDLLPVRRPYDALVNTLTTWGRVFEEHYRVTIPIGARGLVGLVINNRRGIDRRALVDPVRTPAFKVNLRKSQGSPRLRVQVQDRIVRQPRRDADIVEFTPVVEAEQIAVWLACHSNLIRPMPATHEMIADLTSAIAGARMAVDRLPELRFLGPCPTPIAAGNSSHGNTGEVRTCGAGLRAEKGETWVRCNRCRAQYEVEKIIRAAKIRTEDRWWTLAQIGKYLEALDIKVPRRDLLDLDYHPRNAVPKRGWLHRDSLGREAITTSWIHRDDPPVFRVGDVVRYFERRLVKGWLA